MDFFDIDYRFIDLNYNIIWPEYDYFTSVQYNTTGTLHAEGVYPNVWVKGDNLAKAAYSTILIDLGQNDTTNILLNTTALQKHTENIGNFLGHEINAPPGPATEPYDTLEESTGALWDNERLHHYSIPLSGSTAEVGRQPIHFRASSRSRVVADTMAGFQSNSPMDLSAESSECSALRRLYAWEPVIRRPDRLTEADGSCERPSLLKQLFFRESNQLSAVCLMLNRRVAKSPERAGERASVEDDVESEKYYISSHFSQYQDPRIDSLPLVYKRRSPCSPHRQHHLRGVFRPRPHIHLPITHRR